MNNTTQTNNLTTAKLFDVTALATLDLSSGAKQCQYLKVLNSSLLQIFIILTL